MGTISSHLSLSHSTCKVGSLQDSELEQTAPLSIITTKFLDETLEREYESWANYAIGAKHTTNFSVKEDVPTVPLPAVERSVWQQKWFITNVVWLVAILVPLIGFKSVFLYELSLVGSNEPEQENVKQQAATVSWFIVFAFAIYLPV